MLEAAAGAQRRPKPGNNRPPRVGQQLIRGLGSSVTHRLVVHGANIGAADFSGKAPSFGAAQNGHQSSAKWLNIGGGSSADAEGADGKNVVAATLAGQEKLYF